MILESLLCARNCASYLLKCLILFNFLNTAMRQLPFSLLCRWRNWGSERLDKSEVTELEGAGQGHRVYWDPRANTSLCPALPSCGLRWPGSSNSRLEAGSRAEWRPFLLGSRGNQKVRAEKRPCSSVGICLTARFPTSSVGPSPWLWSRMGTEFLQDWVGVGVSVSSGPAVH